MLNELNKNHMGGLENYGKEELYHVDDGWGEEKEPPYSKHEFKSKVSSQHHVRGKIEPNLGFSFEF